MSAKLSKILVCLLIAGLVISGCTSQKVKIVNVERVDSFGYPGMPTANARPGYDILLIGVKTDVELSAFSDLALKDSAGNIYPVGGPFSGKYIFEVPESAFGLILVVKGTTEVPLP